MSIAFSRTCLLAFLSINLLINKALSQDDLSNNCSYFVCVEGGIVRSDTTEKALTLVFTGHEFAEGIPHILKTLKRQKVKAAFFFTGDFYRNPDFKSHIKQLKKAGHYLGAHSDKHLLYCTWENRDSLLVDKATFEKDVLDNYKAMQAFGIEKQAAPFYMPPYEWYNQQISDWTQELGLQIVNFTPGTRSNADYTTPDMQNYISSESIYQSILQFEKNQPNGLNGFILLIHAGTSPKRKDKFYLRLDDLINELKNRGYQFLPITKLLD